jgi:hypothetical protein
LIPNLNHRIESVLYLNLPPKPDGSAAQIRRAPAMRFNFLWAEPLRTLRVLGRATLLQARRICAAITAGVVLPGAAASLSHGFDVSRRETCLRQPIRRHGRVSG